MKYKHAKINIIFIIIALLLVAFFTNTICKSIITNFDNSNMNIKKSYIPFDYPDQWNTNSNSEWGVPSPEKLAQSFQPTRNILTRVELYCWRMNLSSGTIKISIRNNLYGLDLTARTKSVTSIPYGDWTNSAWVEFDFPDISVTPEQTYYIVWEPSSTDSGNLTYWRNQAPGTYNKGTFWWYDGGTWYSNATDFTFRTYGINNSAPTVSITYPENEENIANSITITGIAQDLDGNEQLEEVSIRIDNESWITANGTTNWSYYWDSRTVEDGFHTLYARSFDGYLYSDEDFVIVNVSNSGGIIVNEILGDFRVSAVIENTGSETIYNIPWSIEMEGGTFLAGEYSEGFIPELEAGNSMTLRQFTLFGVGNTIITVTADINQKQATAFILGPLVLALNEL